MNAADHSRFPMRWFAAITLAGLIVRLALAVFAPHPGVSDPTHYYNLARSLADGRGFVIDYIWQYHTPPEDVTHPDDYWMPLPAVYPALSMTVFGKGVFAAILPSVIFGALLAPLAYWVAAVMQLPIPARLMAMAGTVFLPEYVLNAVRTDTTITYALFVGAALTAFHLGLRRNPRWLIAAGGFAGLAHLTRQDGVILAPAMLLGLLVYARWGTPRHANGGEVGSQGFRGGIIPYRWLIGVPLAWGIVIAPWLLRNLAVLGAALPSGAGRTLFMTSFIDQFTYGRALDLQHYLDWGVGNILSNIAFQTLANVKTLYVVLDIGLPILALIGIGRLWLRRAEAENRERLLLLVTPAIFALGLFAFYSFVTPFHTAGGSFKKSYLALAPFLAVAGAWALWTSVQPRRVGYAVAALMMGFMMLNGVELTRADFNAAARYDASIADLSELLNTLGDSSGDGRIIVMTQDPFMLNYHGFYALMLPSDPREMILEAAYRYEVDYIILPAAREGLDALYDQREIDPRLPWIAESGSYQILQVVGE